MGNPGQEEHAAMPDPLFQKIDCLRFNVPDLDPALRLYRDKLGLPLAWRTEGSAGLHVGESELVICQGDPGEPETDIKVASAESAARRFVEAGGSIVTGPFDIKIGKCVVVADPWGNKLVLLDSTKGTLRTDKHGWVVS
jgi:lactoylglutathione lyase